MTKQQRLVLLASILASFVAFLDIAVVNVALPAIRRDLGGGLAAQQWIVDAYLIVLGSLILIAGSISDIFGRKRVLTSGLIGFAVASVLCAVAPNINFLIAARAFQGAAGALLVPSSLALIISSFSGPLQGKAIGIWSGWTPVSFIVGPLLGGFLVDSASWRWVFGINVIPIALTLWLIRLLRMEREHLNKSPIDVVGAILCAVGLGGPVYALIEQPRLGWGHPLIYLSLIIGLLVLAGFLFYENHIKHPMLPLRLFRRRNFSVGNVATFVIYGGLTSWTFLLILFLQQVGGYSALAAGAAVLPVTLLMLTLSPRMGALAGKYGPRFFMGAGPIIAACGFLLALRIDAQVHYFSQLLPGIIVFGLGLATTVAPLTTAILGDVEKEHAGIASAINNAVARIAGLLAVAAIGAVVAAQFSSSINKTTASLANVPASAIAEAKTKPLDISIPSNVPKADQPAFKQTLQGASVRAFRLGILSMAALLASGGLIAAVGIKNPRR